MKNPKSNNNPLSRRAFIKSVAAGGGALCLLGMANSLTAQDLEVYSEPNRVKGINEPIGSCAVVGEAVAAVAAVAVAPVVGRLWRWWILIEEVHSL